MTASRGNRLAVVLSGAALAISIGWNGVPALAGAIVNADKVDGLRAVRSGATVHQRKGKLVATNRHTGRLPNNIIAKAPNSAKLGGRRPGEFLTTTAAGQTYLTQTNAASSYLTPTAAALTYLAKADAASTYLKKTDAASTYVAKNNLSAVRGDYLLATNGRSMSTPFPGGSQVDDVIQQTFHTARPGHLFVQMTETLSFECSTDGDYGTEWLKVDGTDVRSSAVMVRSNTAADPTMHTVILYGITDASVPAGDHTVTLMVGCNSSNWAGLSWFTVPPSAYAVVVPNNVSIPTVAGPQRDSGLAHRTPH